MQRDQVKLRAFEMELDARRDMHALEAEAFRTLVHAVVERRIDAVHNGFTQIMAMHADQARSYAAQHEKLIDGLIKSSDPLERCGLTSRAGEVDMQLRRVRVDALRLYKEMTRVILLIGGKPPEIPSPDRSSLQLS